MQYSFCLPKLSQLCLSRAVDTSLALDIFKQSEKQAAVNSKAAVKFPTYNAPQVCGLSNTLCHGVRSRDLGKLSALFLALESSPAIKTV